ncbi:MULTISPECIES: tape measure protein [Elizabethkingia]|uniref:tape measure protein n=1 Tax=Elizabethkingia TaxID=308865 RepID=UPI0021A335AA|nr:tape measure protein [Elizabethkingia sp. HX CGY]MCT3689593.1 tape measure protein [Elizabethkingia anophelis]MCT3706319.1 tape measure protein [Elizabethkingia anophelis]MCT3713337.1 tape measure protein [Elizabethkingia anophelis]MCT3716755.1 tape measure protein [Elizabethkingia anophelis]MCT3730486.1 tape measure protein [Elizabethkingia anophelis]
MNNSQGALYFGAGIDMTQWRNSINEMRRDIFSLNNSVQQEARNIDSAFKNLSLGIAGYFSARSLLGFTKELINVRGEFQKTEIAFSTMLGDGAKAKQLMGQMVDLAAKTPFSLQDVSSGAKQLLAFQIPAKEVVDTLTRMGNIASGLGVPLSRINLVYGQVKAKGKLMGDDLRQFTEAGIPMVAELANKFKKSESEITAMVSAGKIGFKDVKDVLFSLTNEGGMFFNLMEKQSASVSGKISNLEDAWDQMLNKMGEANEGILNDAIDGLAYLVDNYEEVIKVLKVLIATYGAYRAALILTAVVQKAVAIGQSISAWISLARSIKTAADAQALFNLTASANPYGAILAALALVVSSYIVYGDEIKRAIGLTKEATSEMKFQESIEKQLTETFSKGVSEKRAQIQNLIAVINSENSKLEDRKRAYEKLIAIDPTFRGALDNQYRATLRLGDAFDQVIKKMQAFASAQAKLAAVKDIIEKNAKDEFNYSLIKTKIDTVSKNFKFKEGGDFYRNVQDAFFDKKITAEERDQLLKLSKSVREYSEAVKDSREQLKAGNKVQENDLKYYNKKINQIDELEKRGWKMQDGRKYAEKYIEGFKKDRAQFKTLVSDYLGLDDVTPEIAAGGAKKGTQRWYEEEVIRLKEANKELVPQSKEWLKNMALIKKYNDLISVKSSKDNKQLAEILPLGSIKELERRRKLLRDALDSESGDSIRIRRVDQYGQERDKKGNPYYTGEVVSRQKAGEMLAKIDDEINKKQTKSLDERLSETRRQIEVRDKLIQQGYSKEYVDGMFPDVKDTSFLEYLDKLSEKLAKTNGKEAAENLIKVRDITTEYTGEKTFIDNVNQQIEKLKSKFSGNELIEKLEKLKKANLEGTTENNRNEKNKLLNKAQEDERMRIEANYNQLLNDHKTFEEKKAKITKDLNDALSLAKNDSERDKIKKAYGEQLSALTVEAFRASKDWEIAFSNIEYVSRSTAERVVKQLIEWRNANKNALSPQDYKIVSDKIEEFQRKAVSIFSVKPIISAWKDYRDASNKTKAAEKELEEANRDLALSFIMLKAISSMSAEEARVTIEKYNSAVEKAAKAKRRLDEEQGGKDTALNRLKKQFTEWGDEVSKNVSLIGGAINSVEGIVTDLGGSLDNEFGDALEKMKGVLEGVSQVADGMKEFATGGPVGMVTGSIKMIGGLIKSVSSLFNNDRKKERAIKREAEALKGLKSAYEDLAYAANKALGSDKYDAEKRSLQNIRDQQARLREMYRIEGDKKKSDSGKMDEYKEQIKSLDRQYQDLVDSIAKDFLQTDAKDMASQLTDGLVEALSKGESALDSLDKKANDVFANMAKAWVRSRLEKSMGDIFDKMLAESGVNKDGTGTFNPLSSDRMNYYKELMKNAGLEQQKFLEQYKEFFQDANSSPKGLEGAVKSITSEEAGELVAQMNAIRINQGKMLEMQDKSSAVMRESLIQLSKIEFNTSRLHNIDKNMAELNSKITNNNGLRGSGL